MKPIAWLSLAFVVTGGLFLWAFFRVSEACEAKGGVYLSRANVCIQKGVVIQ
jgi:hypothetical protein